MAPVFLEIQPMSLFGTMESWDDELENFCDLLNNKFNAECTLKGYKKDPKTGYEVQIDCEPPDEDTPHWRGAIGKDWCLYKFVGWPGDEFSVAYVSVKDSDKAKHVIKQLKGNGFAGSVIQVKEVSELPELVPHRDTPPSLRGKK